MPVTVRNPGRNDVPLVSVCMPVFNYGHLIGEAIESVLRQDCPSWQLLISDNCSTDNTAEVAHSFTRLDPRIHYFRNSSNLGYAGNVNGCLKRVTGRYTTILAADDLYLGADFLSRSVEVMEQNPRVAFLHSAFWELDAEGRQMTEMKFFPSDRVFPGREEFKNLLEYTYVYISTAVIRSSLLQKLGGMDSQAGSFADWDLFCRLALNGDIYYCAEPRVGIRQHELRMTAQQEVCASDLRSSAGLRFYRSMSQRLKGDPLRSLCRKAGKRFSKKNRQIEQYNPRFLQERMMSLVGNWKRDGKRVVVFGLGFHTERLLSWTPLRDAHLVGFSDNDTRKQGITFRGLPVVPPAEIESLQPDVILISSNAYQDEIYRQLRKEQGKSAEIVRIY